VNESGEFLFKGGREGGRERERGKYGVREAKQMILKRERKSRRKEEKRKRGKEEE
jgi:hypothetical protein